MLKVWICFVAAGYCPVFKKIKYKIYKDLLSDIAYIQDVYEKSEKNKYLQKVSKNGLKEIVITNKFKIDHILLINDFVVYKKEYQILKNIENDIINGIIKKMKSHVLEYKNLFHESKENIISISKYIFQKIENGPFKYKNDRYLTIYKKNGNIKDSYIIKENIGLYINNYEELEENNVKIISGDVYEYTVEHIQIGRINNYKFNDVTISYLYNNHTGHIIEINFNDINIYYMFMIKTTVEIENDNREKQINNTFIFKISKNENLLNVIKNKKNNNNMDRLPISYTSFGYFTLDKILKEMRTEKEFINTSYLIEYLTDEEIKIENDDYCKLKKWWVTELYKSCLSYDSRSEYDFNLTGELSENEVTLIEMILMS